MLRATLGHLVLMAFRTVLYRGQDLTSLKRASDVRGLQPAVRAVTQKNRAFQWTSQLKAGPAVNLQHAYPMIPSFYAVICVYRALIVNELVEHGKFSNSSEFWTEDQRKQPKSPALALTTLFTIILFYL